METPEERERLDLEVSEANRRRTVIGITVAVVIWLTAIITIVRLTL